MEIAKSKRGGARPNTGGARPGAGRKSKAEEMGLQALLEDVLDDEKRKDIVRNLYAVSQCSDAKAAVSASSLLLAYMYGKPTERIEHHIQLKQAGEEWLRFKADFGSPEIDEAELLAVFAEIKQLPPELISEAIQ